VAAEPVAVYNLDGTGTPLLTGSPCDVNSDTCGTATGDVTCPSIRFSPTDPYRSLRVAGTLTITWDTGLVSTAAVSGRFIDGKPFLALSGASSRPIRSSASASTSARIRCQCFGCQDYER
jgi:hypothetical protein